MPEKEYKVGDLILVKYKCRYAKIIEVNDFYGWIKVRHLVDGFEKTYSTDSNTNSNTFKVLSAVERADAYLVMESMGITDEWRD